MYLSRIWLDMGNRDTVRALAGPRKFHGAVEAADPAHGRKLWRVDSLGGRKCLLVLSKDALDLSGLAGQFGDGSYEQADYGKLLDRVGNGTAWQFRLRANPVVGKIDANGAKVRFGRLSATMQEEWLANRAEKNGFSLADDGFRLVRRDEVSFKKPNGDVVRFASCDYEGTLTVVDDASFRSMLVNGLGREKAYGQGLMTIVPA